MSIFDLPLEIDDGFSGHEVHHELIHEALRGTPQWAQSGQMIDYDEVLTDVSTSAGAGVAVGTSIVVPAQSVPYFVYFGGFGYSSQANGSVIFDLIRDGESPTEDSAGDTSGAANALTYGFKGVYQPAFTGANRVYTCKVRPLGGGTAHALGAANSGGHKFVWALYAISA